MNHDWTHSDIGQRVLSYALDPRPVWFWNEDGSVLIWRNLAAKLFRSKFKKKGLKFLPDPEPLKGQVSRLPYWNLELVPICHPRTERRLSIEAVSAPQVVGHRMAGPDGHRCQQRQSGYRYYVLAALTVTYLLSFMDRQILSILLQDLRAEFNFNDTQLGLLSGLSFALFYTTLAIPVARLADRYNRVKIISLAMAIWSIMTALCGAATGFVTLFLARMGVGVGEAGGTAPSHSLLADYFDERQLPRALGIFGSGVMIGAVAGLALGGLMAEYLGWRWAFVAAGLPGVILAVILLTTVREPVRAKSPGQETDSRLSILETFKQLLSHPVYRNAMLCHAFAVAVGYAGSHWLPEFFFRSYGLERAEIITIVAVIIIAGSLVGVLSGGFIVERLMQHNRKWQGWIPMIGSIVATPLFALAYSGVLSFGATIAAFIIASLLLQWNYAPPLALIQSTVSPDRRALAAALVFLFSNILGLAIGPLVVGAISDVVSATAGDNSLGQSLAIFALVGLIAGFFAWRTARNLPGGPAET